MRDAPRITVDELRSRMETGEEFTFIDSRNPDAWAQSNAVAPKAIRIFSDKVDENLARIPREKPIVTYCT
jgi:rhodanese-related sulfurtransferase